MKPPTSEIATAFYGQFAWWLTQPGIFLLMLFIVAIVMGICIYIDQAETAKRVELQRIANEQAQAGKEWNETPTLTKAGIVARTVLDVFVFGKKFS